MNPRAFLPGSDDDLEYYVRECGDILGVTSKLAADCRDAKHILDHIFAQVVEFKKLNQVCCLIIFVHFNKIGLNMFYFPANKIGQHFTILVHKSHLLCGVKLTLSQISFYIFFHLSLFSLFLSQITFILPLKNQTQQIQQQKPSDSYRGTIHYTKILVQKWLYFQTPRVIIFFSSQAIFISHFKV